MKMELPKITNLPGSEYPFIIAVDTREQAPFTFANYSAFPDTETPIYTRRVGLKTGDYSIMGLEKRVCIERKSKQDLFGSVTTGRERFEREFQRMSQMDRAALVCEASQESILEGFENSQMDGANVLRTFLSWSGRYRVPCFFCTNRAEAEWVTLEFLRFFWKELTAPSHEE